MKKIILTGGGTAGHVMPNLALMEELEKLNWEVHYIGSKDGIERSLVSKENIPYHPIRTGKLRRYFDLKNFLDPFNVLIGIIQAIYIIFRLKPSIVFSKGGFVGVPVIIAAWINRVPSITHEGDISVGLANKLSLPFVKKIGTAFAETTKFLPQKKAVYTGLPIRKELLSGDKSSGYELCGFKGSIPVILVMGGSLGSLNVNRYLRGVLSQLLKEFQIVHICGKGNIDHSLDGIPGYKQFEFLSAELPHIFSISDLVISRAGTNSVFELLSMKKVCLFIPLSTSASRGEQVLNANYVEKNGFGQMLNEKDIDNKLLLSKINYLYNNKDTYLKKMNNWQLFDGTAEIIKLIDEYSN